MFTTRKTSNDNAGTLPGDEFRSDDWYLLPWDDTVQDDSRINCKTFPIFPPLLLAVWKYMLIDAVIASWNWGAAASSPSAMKNDICNRWDAPAKKFKPRGSSD